MKNIQIRDVPEPTHSVLKKRAAEAGQSLQEYLLAMINESAGRPTTREVLARAGRRSGGRVTVAAAARDLRAERERR